MLLYTIFERVQCSGEGRESQFDLSPGPVDIAWRQLEHLTVVLTQYLVAVEMRERVGDEGKEWKKTKNPVSTIMKSKSTSDHNHARIVYMKFVNLCVLLSIHCTGTVAIIHILHTFSMCMVYTYCTNCKFNLQTSYI